jgi:hypothetical protein
LVELVVLVPCRVLLAGGYGNDSWDTRGGVVEVVAEEVAVVDTPTEVLILVVATEVDTIIKILDRRPPTWRQASAG